MVMPPALQSAVADWLLRQGGGNRRDASAALSGTYRAGGGSQHVDLAAYLTVRLPATHAAISRVLAELAARRPDFAPATMLDAGAGPGTASWAAVEHWPEIGGFTFLDTSPAFLSLAGELARSGPPALAAAERRNGNFAAMPAGLAADLVVAAYALAELHIADVPQVSDSLWRASRRALVLVEPGTPQGFARIRQARDHLLRAGAVPVAPCPHTMACPLASDDWCHFAVRLARSRAHMHAKAARVPFEDEKFSYLIASRDGAPTGGARVLRPPARAKPWVDLRLCAEGNAENRRIARRDGPAYKQAKDMSWGDFLPPEENT